MSGAVAALFLVALVGAASAEAHPAAPAGHINSLTASPGTVANGDTVHAVVEFGNPRLATTGGRDVLLKLRAPGGQFGSLLARQNVAPLPPGKLSKLELDLTIPADAPRGDSLLVACRARKANPDACGISRQTQPLTVVAPANLDISPTPQGFGTHATGTASGARTFTVTNTGGAPTGAISTSIAGDDPGQFAKTADQCDGRTLTAGSSCTIDGAFAPTSNGAKAAGLQVTASPGGTAKASLTGTGAPPANLTIGPSPKDYGTVATGTTSGAQTFTVTNTGGVPSGTLATSVAGANAGQFTKSADNCDGHTLAVGASCTVDGAFTPSTTGAKSASLQVTATPGGSATASISGTGANPANLNLNPPSNDFGTIARLTTSGTRQFTVSNTGGVPSGALSVASTDPSNFSIVNDSCNGQTLAPSTSCAIDVAFSPTSNGAKSANLIASATPGGSDSSSLTGTAVDPAQLSADGDVNFGTILVNDTSSTHTVTVTNTGGVPSGTITTAKTGTNSTQFTVGTDTCNGQTLAPAGTCTVDVTFGPTSSGAKSANLGFSAIPGGSTSSVLTGTGQTPANLTLTPSPYDFGNVLHGTTVSKQFTVTNTGEQAATGLSFGNSGANFTQFTPGTDCGSSLPGGGTCHVTVSWSPPGAFTGGVSATLTAISTEGGSPSSALTGNAVATQVNLTVSPTSFSSNSAFAASGSAGDQQSIPVEIKNTGAADTGTMDYSAQVNNASLTPSLAFSPSFAGHNGCGTIIHGGETCVVYMGLRNTSASPVTTWDGFIGLGIGGVPGTAQTFHWTN